MAAKSKQRCGDQAPSSSSRKVKTGCHTCKRRKVKCDEGWPVCNRCLSTGRICDGYGIWGGGSLTCDPQTNRPKDKSIVSTRQQSPINSIELLALRSNGEKECFEWFIRRSAVKLPGVFRSDNWTTTLFQASTMEPAIRHAVLALSSAHKEEVRGIDYVAQEDDGQSIFTTSQYSKAITSLQPSLGNGEEASMRVALVSCVLFIWMEFLRGHYQNSIVHLEYGLSLLRQSNVGVKGKDPWSTCIDGWIITFFTRILVQARMLGQTPRLACQSHLGLDLGLRYDRFYSIHHARRSLEHITLGALDISQQSEWFGAGIDEASKKAGFVETRDGMLHALKIWLSILDTTANSLGETGSYRERFAYRILRHYYYMTCIIVGTCLPVCGEMQFDQHESTFLNIISHCIETHKLVFRNGEHVEKSHVDPEPCSPNSISDLGWIAPLYYTAIKCRNHRIRHHAIRFLEVSQHKEGIWNAPMAVAIVKRVAQIEEESFYDCLRRDTYDDLDIPTDQDLIQPALPLDRRIDKIDLSLPNDRLGKLVLRCRRPRHDGTVEWIVQECDIRSYRWVHSS